MALKRSSTWLTDQLPAYLASCEGKPFAWGELDCCLFAAGAIQAITGTDIAADFRGKYTDQASAMAAIAAVTGGSGVLDAIEYCAKKYELEEWTRPDGTPLPLMARRGDLCAVRNAGNIIAGVVDLSGRYAACMSDAGFERLNLSAITRAWHVKVG